MIGENTEKDRRIDESKQEFELRQMAEFCNIDDKPSIWSY